MDLTRAALEEDGDRDINGMDAMPDYVRNSAKTGPFHADALLGRREQIEDGQFPPPHPLSVISPRPIVRPRRRLTDIAGI